MLFVVLSNHGNISSRSGMI